MQSNPEITSSLPIVLDCEKMGLSPIIIKTLLEKEEIHIKGEIYSSRHFKSFKVENLKLSIKYDQKEKSKILKIEDIQCQKWLEEKYKESLKFSLEKVKEIVYSIVSKRKLYADSFHK